jgi:hypothetical protein
MDAKLAREMLTQAGSSVRSPPTGAVNAPVGWVVIHEQKECTMTRNNTRIVLVIGLVAASTVGFLGCSSATPTDTPGVDELGRYVLRQEGPQVDAVLGYRFATNSIGADWLLLEVNLSSPRQQSAEIKRENVWVRTPDGTRVPMASQRLFGEDYGSLRPVIDQANIQRDPMDYFPPNRRDCRLQFFVGPGDGVAFDEVSVNDRRACQGKLFFKIPGGVQPGRWTLGIDLEESTVRIPFQI